MYRFKRINKKQLCGLTMEVNQQSILSAVSSHLLFMIIYSLKANRFMINSLSVGHRKINGSPFQDLLYQRNERYKKFLNLNRAFGF